MFGREDVLYFEFKKHSITSREMEITIEMRFWKLYEMTGENLDPKLKYSTFDLFKTEIFFFY